jgi:TATA-binding protein-associated factor
VICPNTLTYNWKSEIEKFFEGQNVCVVEVLQHEREMQLSPEKMSEYDIVIINYEKVKKCLPQLCEKEFFYLVLDEAHKIKNAKSVVTQSVKQLTAKRKLALSGTPLQNRVAELWSLFDFLMPNFLEEESVFNKTYNKYLTANIKKMSENLEETESFINALKSLKRRIAPFILRRTKEQVLKELPPKVIQDYPCSMPTFQSKIHEEVDKKFPFASNVQ